MHLKMSSAKRRPFCPGGDELIPYIECLTFCERRIHPGKYSSCSHYPEYRHSALYRIGREREVYVTLAEASLS